MCVYVIRPWPSRPAPRRPSAPRHRHKRRTPTIASPDTHTHTPAEARVRIRERRCVCVCYMCTVASTCAKNSHPSTLRRMMCVCVVTLRRVRRPMYHVFTMCFFFLFRGLFYVFSVRFRRLVCRWWVFDLYRVSLVEDGLGRKGLDWSGGWFVCLVCELSWLECNMWNIADFKRSICVLLELLNCIGTVGF